MHVTKRGCQVRRRISDVLERHMWDVLESWSPADRHRLSELLGRLVDDLRAVQYRPPATRPATMSNEDGDT